MANYSTGRLEDLETFARAQPRLEAMLCAYELERLENIRKNNAQLESLGLSGGQLIPAAKAIRPTQQAKQKAVDQEPQRRSSRIKNAPAPAVYIENEVCDDEGGKRKGREKPTLTVGGADAQSLLAELDEDPDALPIEPEQLTSYERKVYEHIREVRNAKAKSMARSMFIVCGNRTIVEMCRLVPSTPQELLELHGMGELKVQRYGDLLLEALRPHAAQLRAEHEVTAAARAVSDGKSPASVPAPPTDSHRASPAASRASSPSSSPAARSPPSPSTTTPPPSFERVRAWLAEQLPEELPMAERRMFGGHVLFLRGHMLIGVMSDAPDALAVRVGQGAMSEALERPGARPFHPWGDAKGAMAGWISVDALHFEGDEHMPGWLEMAMTFNRTLKDKGGPPNSSKKQKRR